MVKPILIKKSLLIALIAFFSIVLIQENAEAAGWTKSLTNQGFSIAADSTGVYVYGRDAAYKLIIEKRDLNTGDLIPTFGTGGIAGPLGGLFPYSIEAYNGDIYTSTIGYGTLIAKKYDINDGTQLGGTGWNPSSCNDYPSGMALGNNRLYIAGRVECTALVPNAWAYARVDLPGFTNNIGYTADRTEYEDKLDDVTVDSTGVYFTSRDCFTGGLPWGDATFSKWSFDFSLNLFDNSLGLNSYSYYSQADLKLSADNSGIYMFGWEDNKFVLRKYDTSGNLIPGFGNNGEIVYNVGDTPVDMEIDSTNIYTLHLSTGNQVIAQARHLNDGSIDGTKLQNGQWNFGNNLVPINLAIDGNGGVYALVRDASWNMYLMKAGSTAPPTCTTPSPVAWTDPIITADVTKIRKVHVDELRTEIDNRRIDAGLVAYSWTDPTITADSTLIRAVHFEDMRTAIEEVYTACSQAAPSWTDPVLTADSTKIRKIHMDELRSATNNAP